MSVNVHMKWILRLTVVGIAAELQGFLSDTLIPSGDALSFLWFTCVLFLVNEHLLPVCLSKTLVTHVLSAVSLEHLW